MRRYNHIKRFMMILLALLLCLENMPISAFAEEETSPERIALENELSEDYISDETVEKQKQERQRCCRSGENKFPFLPPDNQMSNSQHGNFGYDKCGCHFLGEVGYEADHAKQHRHKQDCPYPDAINNSPAKCSKNEEIKGSLTEKQAVRSCINRI